MASHIERIFVELTGKSVITECQREGIPNRIENLTEEQTVSTYLDSIARANSLDDAIEQSVDFL
jgi:hypothetical protein